MHRGTPWHIGCISFDSYIKPQLFHYLQTVALCCISFDSYIKPQPSLNTANPIAGCISFDSYIKPQLGTLPRRKGYSCISFDSYIKPQLDFENCEICASCISFDSYIKPQPISSINSMIFGCISFDSYIKPQRHAARCFVWQVVYLLIPTSNHNFRLIILMLTSLYIFWFLHQTTTLFYMGYRLWRCISFDSYIKPQPSAWKEWDRISCISFDSYIKPQHMESLEKVLRVVYLLIPTSNHNFLNLIMLMLVLYIFWFLHQTTTKRLKRMLLKRCISFDSYIKPQQANGVRINNKVVYLLIPTSNHNLVLTLIFLMMLYIFWFLHQTTTFT